MRYRRDVDPIVTRLSRAGLVAGALLLAGAPAHAQTASEVATAKRWFSDGLASEEKGDYAAALELFRRASQVKKTAQIVYHVGLCESRTGALVEALVDLDTASALARATRTASADKVVQAAQAELAEVRTRTPSLEVRVGAADKADRLLVDGHSIALSMLGVAMPLNPGEHTVSVVLAAGTTVTKAASLVEHDAKVLDLSSPPTPSGVVPVPAGPVEPLPATPAPPPPAPPEPSRGSSPLPWVFVGGGAGLAALGATLFGIARADAGSLDSSCPSHTGCSSTLQSKYNTAVTLNGVGLAIGAVGIAAAGVGVTMLVLRPSASSSAALRVTPSGALLSGRF